MEAIINQLTPPVPGLTGDAAELRGLALRLEELRGAGNRTQAQLLRDYPALSTSKTYWRVLRGSASDMAELDIPARLRVYRQTIAAMEAGLSGDSKESELLPDLSPALRLRLAVVDVLAETGNARVILMTGYSGSGKTSARRLVEERYGARVLSIEASEAWGDRPYSLLTSILKAAGRTSVPARQFDALEETVTELTAARREIIVDEAHHLGPRTLNTLKTLVNRTPGSLTLLALPNLWTKLESGAYCEARQLTGNRLAERIRLEDNAAEASQADVEALIHARTGLDGGEARRAAHKLAVAAPRLGNLAFVRDTCARYRRAVRDDNAEPGAALLMTCAEEERQSR